MEHLTHAQRIKFAAIQWRNDHLEHCAEECNVSLHDLLEMAVLSGAEFTPEEAARFLLTQPMEFIR